MAVNRFMKPADQPLLNTYVKLPYEQMAMAYNQVQKEHDAGEKFAGTLDDELLKVRASTPLHSEVLGSIRSKLDEELSVLYDKHGGRYADMVPELTQIKNSLDKDFNDGNLYGIKETTRALEEDLNPGKAKAREDGNYSEIYNPLFGAERDWSSFYENGLVKDESTGEWKFEENVTSGYTMKNGRPVLTPFTYKGLHRPSEQLKIANEQTFDKIKQDSLKWTSENPNSGETKIAEQKGITRSKIYQGAMTDMGYYPDNMRLEVNAEIASMSEKQRIGAAVHAANAIFGEPVAGTEAAKQKDKIITQINNDPEVAAQYAKADYIGFMGEKYVFGDETESSTFDNSVFNQNKYPIEKSDWVPKIGDNSAFTAGTIRNENNEMVSDLSDPINSYIDIVNNKAGTYNTLVKEYEQTKGSYDLDDAYHKEWSDKINLAKYQYEGSAMALFDLTQRAAGQLNTQETNEGIRYQDGAGNWKYVDRFDAAGNVNPKWETEGWSSIQFDASGDIEDVENINRQAATPNDNIYRYMDVAKGLFSNVSALGGSTNSELMQRVNSIQSNEEFFSGRSTSAQTLTSTGSKRVDAEINTALPGMLGAQDQVFLTSAGDQVKWGELVSDGVISQETLDGFLNGDFNNNVVWLANPNPDGTYYGALTLPSGAAGSTDTTDLFFTAPSEVRRTWRNQGEFERQLTDGSGMTEIITRPRTESEKQLWDANELAQIDFSRAATTPGGVAMSSAEDGENNPLGYYYFNQDPDGRTITNEQYVFQPRAGLVKDIVNGQPVYTTGNELFNADTDAQQVGMLITLNDPTYAGAKAYWSNQFKSNPNPIAREGIPVTVPSEARGIDIDGMQFSSNLRAGQVMLPENRFTQQRASNANSQGFAYNNMMTGLNGTAAEIIGFTTKNYNTSWGAEIESSVNTGLSQMAVTMNDGTVKTYEDALNSGDLTLVPVSGVNGNFSLPLASGARSFTQQKEMYDAYVAGGRVGDPVADPENGGFHVMGQAIDLSSNKDLYDWILVDNTGQIATIGNGNTSGAHSAVEGYDRTSSTLQGFKVSELTNASGGLVIPDYSNSALTALFDELGKTPDDIKKEQKRSGSYKEANVLPDFKQFDKEWWHWSLGELTGASSGYVYPSWAN